jgi:hypothetical protein
VSINKEPNPSAQMAAGSDRHADGAARAGGSFDGAFTV